jgi:colanic acid/amylovoran biosynthesis glycosyltransferase
MKIAYLTNQYPKVSHTFIRREIEALEAMFPEMEVCRFSVRRSHDPLQDNRDLSEMERTVVVLSQGPLSFAMAVLWAVAVRPLPLIQSLRLTFQLGWNGDRGLLRHFAYLLEAIWLSKRLRRDNVQHLHAHFGTNSTTVALLAHALSDIPFSFTVHGPEEFDKSTILGIDTKIRHAAFVVAISDFGRSQLMRWCPSSQWSKLHVVRCGVDAFYLDTPPSKVFDNQTLVCVGRLCEQKGQLLLIEAAGKLVEQGVNVQLRLVGDGPMRSECEAAIGAWKIQKQVGITGWASGEQVRDEIANARIFVLPSFAEGLPVVIMEALALERPVISTYVAGIPELVKPGVNGWLVPAGDVDSLVNAIREALETPIERLREMGACGSQAVREQHDIRKEAAKLAKLLHGL